MLVILIPKPQWLSQICLSAYLQPLFLAARLVLIPFESQQEGRDKCRSYMELVGRCIGFFPLCGYLVHRYLFERPPAYIHCHPILYGWTSLDKKESTFHMCWLCLFVFLLRLLYGWISFQARKKESTYVFIGERTPAQAFSTFCSSTQSTDGRSDTRAFILTWTQCIHKQLLQVRDVWI